MTFRMSYDGTDYATPNLANVLHRVARKLASWEINTQCWTVNDNDPSTWNGCNTLEKDRTKVDLCPVCARDGYIRQQIRDLNEGEIFPMPMVYELPAEPGQWKTLRVWEEGEVKVDTEHKKELMDWLYTEYLMHADIDNGNPNYTCSRLACEILATAIFVGEKGLNPDQYPGAMEVFAEELRETWKS